MIIGRREFIAAPALVAAHDLHGRSASARGRAAGVDTALSSVLRAPDGIAARLASGAVIPLAQQNGGWTTAGLAVRAEPEGDADRASLRIEIDSAREGLTQVQLRWRWQRRIGDDPLILSDAWERGYGDLRWQGLAAERVMPWYFALRHAGRLTCFGVETQANALCFWQCDPDGVSLWLDLRNGGEPAQLSGRRLAACRIVMAEGAVAEPITEQVKAFCAALCPSPRLPQGPIVGSNDWNYAYGNNTAAGILRDARLMAELAPSGYRPFVVIDDGWQDRKRFPDLAGLASQIRTVGARPGIWIRPLRAAATVDATRLPDARFGARAEKVSAFDPSSPDGLDAAVQSVRDARRQGYEFIKHDFSTFDMLGQWGSEMGARPGSQGWHFADRTRTTAEIILSLYRALRREAGDAATVLGCNTIGHLGAGIFESHRVGDDTSGKDWERTRRYGVNSLSFRIAQHRTFFHVDPDIVAITRDIPWTMTSQWLDVVARSGTSLFVAPQPDAMTKQAQSAIRQAMTIAVGGGSGYPLDSLITTTPRQWRFTGPNRADRMYDWIGPAGADPFA